MRFSIVGIFHVDLVILRERGDGEGVPNIGNWDRAHHLKPLEYPLKHPMKSENHPLKDPLEHPIHPLKTPIHLLKHPLTPTKHPLKALGSMVPRVRRGPYRMANL